MITWQQIEYSIIESKLFDTEIDNKFYHDVLEYYFSDISLIIDKRYYKNGMIISTHTTMHSIILHNDFEKFINVKYGMHISNLSRCIKNYIKYKHGINLNVL